MCHIRINNDFRQKEGETMDEKNELIQDIIYKSSTFLSDEELRKISDVLIVEFRDYLIKKDCFELSTDLDDNEKYFRLFIATKKLEGMSKKTISHYVYETRKALDFLNKNFRDVTNLDIQFYLSEYERFHNVSRRSLDNMRRHIAGYYNWLELQGYISLNPLRRVGKISYEKKEVQVLTDYEIQLIREYLSGVDTKYSIRLRAIVEFLLATGVRVSELCSCSRSDIDFQKREVRIVCAKKRDRRTRTIFLNTEAIFYLNKYFEYRDKRGWNNSNSLFQGNNSKSQGINDREVNSQLNKLGVAAGITNKKLTVHIFRKTLASRLYSRGFKPADIAYILGHADTRTSETYYIHIDKEDIKRSYMKLY